MDAKLAPDALNILAAMPEDARSAGVEQLKAAGFDIDPADVPEPQQQQQQKTAPIVQQTNLDGSKTVLRGQGDEALSHAQLVAGYRALIEHGSQPDVALSAALDAGLTLEDLGLTQGDVENVELPASGIDYHFNFAGIDADPSDIATLDGAAKTAFGALEVPAPMAQSIFRRFVEGFDDAHEQMTDEQLAEMRRTEGQKIAQLTNHEEIVRLADAGQAALKQAAPDFHDALYEGGAFHSAEGLLALADLGRWIESEATDDNRGPA